MLIFEALGSPIWVLRSQLFHHLVLGWNVYHLKAILVDHKISKVVGRVYKNINVRNRRKTFFDYLEVFMLI